MRHRINWGLLVSRGARFLYGVVPALACVTAAQGQGFGPPVPQYYSDNISLVSYRPRCDNCGPNCCTCPSAEIPYDGGVVAPAPDSPSDGSPQSIDPDSAYTPEMGDALAPGQFAAGDTGSYVAAAGMQSNVGYIDSAIIWSQVRMRYDAGYGVNAPDRAEFFYSKCQCFSGRGLPERSVDYQDITMYAENAFSDRFSVFAEMAIRFLNPELNDNTAGLGDMQAGMKYALIADPNEYFTFQLKTYIPTGDSDRQTGTGHVSLEPGFLYFNRMGNWRFESELRHWISVGGTDFAGNVLRYGAGLGYDIYADERTNTRLTPIMEWVGWTVLDGGELDPTQPGFVGDAKGDTIVNFKLGGRYTSGYNSVYGGWGHAVTGDIWYDNIFRLEYRRVF